eukprot:Nk52_evm54s153 gene=Nk52_evmTU54s153
MKKDKELFDMAKPVIFIGLILVAVSSCLCASSDANIEGHGVIGDEENDSSSQRMATRLVSKVEELIRSKRKASNEASMKISADDPPLAKLRICKASLDDFENYTKVRVEEFNEVMRKYKKARQLNEETSDFKEVRALKDICAKEVKDLEEDEKKEKENERHAKEQNKSCKRDKEEQEAEYKRCLERQDSARKKLELAKKYSDESIAALETKKTQQELERNSLQAAAYRCTPENVKEMTSSKDSLLQTRNALEAEKMDKNVQVFLANDTAGPIKAHNEDLKLQQKLYTEQLEVSKQNYETLKKKYTELQLEYKRYKLMAEQLEAKRKKAEADENARNENIMKSVCTASGVFPSTDQTKCIRCLNPPLCLKWNAYAKERCEADCTECVGNNIPGVKKDCNACASGYRKQSDLCSRKCTCGGMDEANKVLSGGECEMEEGACTECGYSWHRGDDDKATICTQKCKCGGTIPKEESGVEGEAFAGGGCSIDGSTCTFCALLPGTSNEQGLIKAENDGKCRAEYVCNAEAPEAPVKSLKRIMAGSGDSEYRCIMTTVSSDTPNGDGVELGTDQFPETKINRFYEDYVIPSQYAYDDSLMLQEPFVSDEVYPTAYRELKINCTRVSMYSGAGIALIPKRMLRYKKFLVPDLECGIPPAPFIRIVIDQSMSIGTSVNYPFSSIYAPGESTNDVFEDNPSSSLFANGVPAKRAGRVMYIEKTPKVAEFRIEYRIIGDPSASGATGDKGEFASKDPSEVTTQFQVEVTLRKKSFEEALLRRVINMELVPGEPIYVAVSMPLNDRCSYELAVTNTKKATVPPEALCTKEGNLSFRSSVDPAKQICFENFVKTKITQPLESPFRIGETYLAGNSVEQSAMLISDDGAYLYRDFQVSCRYNADFLLYPKDSRLITEAKKGRVIPSFEKTESTSDHDKFSPSVYYGFVIDGACSYSHGDFGIKTMCNSGPTKMMSSGEEMSRSIAEDVGTISSEKRFADQPLLFLNENIRVRVVTDGSTFYVFRRTSENQNVLVGSTVTHGSVRDTIGAPYYIGIRTDYNIGVDDTCTFVTLASDFKCYCGGFENGKLLVGGECALSGECLSCGLGYFRGEDKSVCKERCTCGINGGTGGECERDSGICTKCAKGWRKASVDGTACNFQCTCGGLSKSWDVLKGGECDYNGICFACGDGYYKPSPLSQMCSERCKCAGQEELSPVYETTKESASKLPCSLTGICIDCKQGYYKKDGRFCYGKCDCQEGTECDPESGECLTCLTKQFMITKDGFFKTSLNTLDKIKQDITLDKIKSVCSFCTTCEASDSIFDKIKTLTDESNVRDSETTTQLKNLASELRGSCSFHLGVCTRCDSGYFLSPNVNPQAQVYHRILKERLLRPSKWCIPTYERVTNCKEYKISDGRSVCNECYDIHPKDSLCKLTLYQNMCVCSFRTYNSNSYETHKRCSHFNPESGRCIECPQDHIAVCEDMQGHWYCGGVVQGRRRRGSRKKVYPMPEKYTPKQFLFVDNPKICAEKKNALMCVQRGSNNLWAKDYFSTDLYLRMLPFAFAYGGVEESTFGCFTWSRKDKYDSTLKQSLGNNANQEMFKKTDASGLSNQIFSSTIPFALLKSQCHATGCDKVKYTCKNWVMYGTADSASREDACKDYADYLKSYTRKWKWWWW